MKILKAIGHQGDTQWYSIDEIPSTAKKVEKQFVATSERSGSVHVLMGNYDMYEHEDGFCLDVKEDSIVNHTLKENLKKVTLNDAVEVPKKDHRHSILKKGLYFVGIQQDFDPLTNQKIKNLD